MHRSSQHAGVRSARNMEYQPVRSLAISLAIVLVITRSPANGFTIRRVESWESTTDLYTGESSLVEVRSDLKALNNMTAFDNNRPKETLSDSIQIPISGLNDATTYGDINNDKITENSTAAQIKESKTTQGPFELSKFETNTTHFSLNLETSSSIQTVTVTEEELNDSNTTISPAVSTYETIVSTSNIVSSNIDDKSTSLTSTATSNLQINRDETSTTDITTNSGLSQNSSTSDSPSSSSSRRPLQDQVLDTDLYSSTSKAADNNPPENTDVTNATQSQKNSDVIETSTAAINTVVTETPSSNVNNDESVTISEAVTDAAFSTESSPTSIESSSHKVDVEMSTEPDNRTRSLSTYDQTKSDINIDTTVNDVQGTKTYTTIETTEAYPENDSPTPTNFLSAETVGADAETVTETTVVFTMPPWKKYQTIDRKRTTTTSTEETMSSNSEMTRAETARFTLEKVLNNTPIPSLVELKNDLLNAQEYTTGVTVTTNATESSMSNAYELETSTLPTTTQKMADGLETRTATLEIVSSKRAGYLDNTEITNWESQQANALLNDNKELANDTDNFGPMYESEVSEGESSELRESKNSSAVESQGQLVEDAIKEELLMEKTLNENELSKQKARYQDSESALDYSQAPEEISTTPGVVTEDLLSVKPITAEKRKNTALYTVSSNYKPLKKLDVQHPKQFVRDPDDNSWRNESISSLGIVFKPKNASKSFTEVLKIKTIELSNLTVKDDKSNVPDLRVRLEKIAEVRKSKKKRINKFGDTVYNDYEENSGENSNSSKEEMTSPMIPAEKQTSSITTPLPPPSTTIETDTIVNTIWKDKINIFEEVITTTEKLKKLYNLGDYYEVADDYDNDYATLSKIDLKKFTVPIGSKDTLATYSPETYATRPANVLTSTKPMRMTYPPDRQPTIQYFPPTKKVKTPITQKVSVNDYDDEFKDRVNLYTYKDTPKTVYDVTFATKTPKQTKKLEVPTKLTPQPTYTSAGNLGKNLYLPNKHRVIEQQDGFVPNDGNFNRASYVIKHYRDFINDAAKDSDDDKVSQYLPYTEPPIQGVTMSQIAKFDPQNEAKPAEEYDYETQFRKDIMTRFVDNFNQNSERFKVDFPILYNNSVVHRKVEENGKVLASSSAFMKRLYETTHPKASFLSNVKPCGVHCDATNVELSPAYELHYYIPDQEEKEEMDPHSNTLPFRYRL